ncbi:hypothetical protein NGM36_37755, partial [Streptomyces mutabilis]|uniref:hypothetical protein n=1 Tax=Streptomyces mutabilis TaxID=67332 RepID=UPI0022BA53D0
FVAFGVFAVPVIAAYAARPGASASCGHDMPRSKWTQAHRKQCKLFALQIRSSRGPLTNW